MVLERRWEGYWRKGCPDRWERILGGGVRLCVLGRIVFLMKIIRIMFGG